MQSITGQDGRAVLDGLEPGDWKLIVTDQGAFLPNATFQAQATVPLEGTVHHRFDLVLVSGQIFITNAAKEQLDLDGELLIRGRLQWPLMRIAVVDGAWNTVFPRGAVFAPTSAWMGETELEIDCKSVRITEDMWIELTAAQYHNSFVRAYDRKTGRPLETFRVIQSFDSAYNYINPPHPSSYVEGIEVIGSLEQTQDGPLIEHYERFWKLWIGAPGYAWNLVLIDRTSPDEFSVPLEPGVDLEIAVQGNGAVLHLDRMLPDGIYEDLVQASDSGTLSAKGLPVGRYVARALTRDGREIREHLELVEGEPATLMLALPPTDLAVGTVRGRVALPNDLNRSLQIRVESLDQPSVVRHPLLDKMREMLETHGAAAGPPSPGQIVDPSSSEVDWTYDDLPEGTYRVVVSSGGGRVEDSFRVAAGSVVEVVQRVPSADEHKQIYARFLNAQTGELIRTGEVVAEQPWLEALGPGHFSNRGVFKPDATGAWLFDAPAVDVPFRANLWGYVPLVVDQALSPGRNDLTLHLQPACMLEVFLLDGEREIHPTLDPWSEPEELEGKVWLEPLDHETSWFSSPSWWSQPLRFGADRSGWFVVHSCPPPDYLPTEPVMVELVAGERARVEIPLHRAWGG